ncbi:hypothetical protein [Flavisphingomonas formosensis]|uniref:hypothetical protein n=1 Tax=Flavisphingomonas formosensis TaxID=861534 RepID=UPI0012FA0D00|nr:hypothetical protein [Sphingomonas formosensis]
MADAETAPPIEAAALELAIRHRIVGLKQGSEPLASWTGLPAAQAWLDQARRAASKAGPHARPAAEWLLDNDYHVRRAILQIIEDLPERFSRRLPTLAGRDDPAVPRVHLLAHGLLKASHLQLSSVAAVDFITQYQRSMPLDIAELWAFPTMLRLACLELLVHAFTRLFPEVVPPSHDDFSVKGRSALL